MVDVYLMQGGERTYQRVACPTCRGDVIYARTWAGPHAYYCEACNVSTATPLKIELVELPK